MPSRFSNFSKYFFNNSKSFFNFFPNKLFAELLTLFEGEFNLQM